MELGDNVSREELELVVKALVLQTQKLAELLSVTIAELVRTKVVSPETAQEIVSRSRRSPTAAKLKDALAKLQDLKTIQDVLRNLEGPLQ
jgi:hypothetical protein